MTTPAPEQPDRTGTAMDGRSRSVPAPVLEPVIGLPRPRLDGLPVPWITPLSPTGPIWLDIDPALNLRCQAEWRCQICGDPLPRRAWVILASDRRVVMDSAMHGTCLAISVRWCPHLHGAEIDAVEVDRSDIYADNQPLTSFSAPGPDDEWGSYGDRLRDWTVPATPPPDQTTTVPHMLNTRPGA